ncbi:unnamed protein product [Closterium sp. Yama58-4]|nr:unnamed protein product [Closterium sp. Yama58-4]
MPPPVAPAVPAAGHSLHDIEGVCDYCGEPCDSTQDELNALSCTFEGCASSGVYHQHCIEAFLKSIRLDKQRKTGFQCPRGNGKATKFDKPCPGRITKSHPIHARNENSKKRRKAKMPEPPPAPVGAAGKKGGKGKDDKKADSKSGDGKKEGKTGDSKKDGKLGDSKKEGKTGDGSKAKGSFSVPSSSSKTSTSLPAAPAPKPTVALLVRSSLPPAAKAAASVAKSASGGAGPTSPSATSGGIGASGGGSGSGGVPVKVLSKSWSAAAAGLKDAAAAAVGAVGSSSGSGGNGPANVWSSSPGIVSGPSKGKASESKAEKISSPKDTSLQQDAITGGKASDKPAAGGAGAEEKSRKDKSGSKAASQEGEGKAENASAAAMAGSAEMAGAAPAVSGGLRPWSDACRFALETNRRRVYVRQLQELGFPLGEAAQAVLVHGGDLGGCLNHLLVYHECSCRPSALSAFTPSPFVDISLELQALSEIMAAGSLPQTTAFPVGPSDPVFAHLSRSASPSPAPSPPSPLPDYSIASPSLVIPLSNTTPGTYSHTPMTTLTPTTTTSSSSSLQHTSLLSDIWSSSSPNLPSAAHNSPAPPPGFGPSLNAASAPLGNSASFGTLEARSGSPAPNLIPGSGWNYSGLPELKTQQRVDPVGGCEAGRKVYVPESIGRLWGASGGAAVSVAAQDDSQWLCGVNSDRSSGTASGLSSCSNSSHGYSQYSEEEGLGDSLLLLPGDEEDLFSRILPGLLG